MKIPIYLALQTFADGRVMFRRCTTAPIEPRLIPGGVYAKKTPEAQAWLESADRPQWSEWQTFEGLHPFEWVDL